MSEEENLIPESGDYDLMLQLDRLESLREDLLDNKLDNLTGLEAALALLVPTGPETEERRNDLQEIRTEMLALNLDTLDEIETQIDRLNQQLDDEDDE